MIPRRKRLPTPSIMPRRPRDATGGYVYHVLNRAVGRAKLFETDGDYRVFLNVMEEARTQTP
jgi:hypothetical protein